MFSPPFGLCIPFRPHPFPYPANIYLFFFGLRHYMYSYKAHAPPFLSPPIFYSTRDGRPLDEGRRAWTADTPASFIR